MALRARALWAAASLPVALALLSAAGGSKAVDLSEPPRLEPRTPLELPLEAGSAVTLGLELVSGRPLLVTIEQLGIDVVVALRDPAGEERLRVNSPLGREASESLLLDAEGDGGYTLEIRSVEPRAPAGHFVARIEELPAATASQRLRLRAEASLTEAGRLWAHGAKNAASHALLQLDAALADWRELADPEGQARTLLWMGALFEHQQDFRRAATTFEQALALGRSLDDPAGLAATLDHLGFAQHQLGQSPRAVTTLEEALALRQRLGQREREAQSRGLLGLALQRSGRWPEAGGNYERALELARELGDSELESRLLNNLGGLAANLGEPEEQLAYLEQALTLRRANGDELGEGISLNNLGAFHRGLGEVDEALLSYAAALRIFERLGNRYWQARTLNNTGYAYLTLGEPERARAALLRALPLRRELGDRQGEATTLRNLARAAADQGEGAEALGFAQSALEGSLELKDRRGATTARKLLGELRLAEGKPAEARRELEAALATSRELGSRPEEAEVLGLLAEVELAQSESSRAAKLASELAGKALVLHRQVLDPLGEIGALVTLARAERALGRIQAAKDRVRAALALLDSLQGRIGEPDRRAAFRATEQRAHELEVDLLMDQHRRLPRAGYDRQALEASERGRSRALLTLLESAGAGLGGALEPKLREQLHRAERLFAAKTQRLPRLLGAEHTPEQARQAEGELLTALADLDTLRDLIRRRNPGYALLSHPPSLDVAAIRRLLGANTVLLEIFLGERRSYLWFVTGQGGKGSAETGQAVTAYELPPRQTLEELAERLHGELGAVQRRDGRLAELLEALGRLLLGPFAERLRDQRLVVVADGALLLVPFGALTSPATGEPLLAHHEVVSEPSAAVLAAQRRAPSREPPQDRAAAGASAEKTLAILADPLFEGRAQLPHTRREAEKIAALVPPGQRLVALGNEARRSRVLAGELSGYRILHFATHGLINPRIPELSGLLLSQRDALGRPLDGFLGLRDVSSLELSAELVVLSGCETALGREVRGEGLLGLARGFMLAGAPRVIASLWQVRDEATAELMARFYRNLLVEHQPPATALRSAQLALREPRRWRDPYYWSGFVLLGDWRPVTLPATAN